MRGELLHQGEFLFESSSINLINNFILEKDFKVIYFPRDITAYLLACENDPASRKTIFANKGKDIGLIGDINNYSPKQISNSIGHYLDTHE